MASKHVIKLTEGEAVLKCYITDANGGTIDISLENDLTRSTEVFNPTNSKICIKGIHWGTKQNKHIDITRVVPADPMGTHGHYFLMNAGSYDYNGFVDNTYATHDIRITGDGSFHVILHLSKSGWDGKIEPYLFGSYDNVNAVGS